MDQLKPLIKHRFWICFGLAVIFTIIGWWVASGNIAEATDTRKASVQDSFTKAKQGGTAPNEKWIEGAKLVNDQNVQAYTSSSKSLWLRQKNARIWPDDIAAEMQGIAYFDQIPNTVTRGKWGAGYGKQFDEILAIIRPFQRTDGTGLVLVDKQRITHKPYNSWRMKGPLSEEVWKNQEDLWLLKSLLTSLARVNDGANRITEASLREIIALRLRGGDPDAKPSAAGGNGMGGGMGSGFSLGAGGGGSSMPGEGMGEAMGGSGQSGAAGGAWRAFEGTFGMDLLTEEFGPAGGAGAGGMGGTSEGGMPGMNLGGFAGTGGMGMPGATGGSTAEADRYVHEGENLPYKTRAFFLHARVRLDHVARLLAELTNSDFPVEIVRVDLKTFSGGAAASTGMMSGGPGGSMGMGGGDMTLGMGGGSEDFEDMMEDGGGMGGLSPGGFGGNSGYGDSGEGSDPGLGDMYEGYGSNGGMLGMGGGENQTGQQALNAAMMDPSLVEIRVAGLMTLYQTQEETEAQIETEAAAVEEASNAAPGQQPLVDETGSQSPADQTQIPQDPASSKEAGEAGSQDGMAPNTPVSEQSTEQPDSKETPQEDASTSDDAPPDN